MPGPKSKYSNKFLEQLRALWAQTDPQLSTAQIGVRLRVNKNKVIGLAARLNLPRRRSPINGGRGPGKPSPQGAAAVAVARAKSEAARQFRADEMRRANVVRMWYAVPRPSPNQMAKKVGLSFADFLRLVHEMGLTEQHPVPLKRTKVRYDDPKRGRVEGRKAPVREPEQQEPRRQPGERVIPTLAELVPLASLGQS